MDLELKLVPQFRNTKEFKRYKVMKQELKHVKDRIELSSQFDDQN